MYALLVSILMSVSQDCSIVIQLALDMEIKYANTDYFIQYEQDCCLGVGVVCENNMVTEIHWGFPVDYIKNSLPIVSFPPNLRVLDLSNNKKSMIIKELPNSLKILDLNYAESIRVELKQIPNLTVFRLKIYDLENVAILPRLPNSLQELHINYFGDEYLPLNPVNLTNIHLECDYYAVKPLTPFPKLTESIEYINFEDCKFYGPISIDFKSIREIDLYDNHLT
eukprot:NODE_685_length_4747_cov_0.548623.p4 type:complete len:224 gc:universal NODE_685_length_4747_cov_0.548623:3924-4595(+)